MLSCVASFILAALFKLVVLLEKNPHRITF